MHILGVNAYHGDASACLIVDGELVAAIEEERIRRVKHWAGLPTEAICWCLGHAGLGLEEIDHIAVGRDTSANLSRKILSSLRRFPTPGVIRDRLVNRSRILDVKKSICSALDVAPSRVRAPVHPVEHHRAHLASAFYTSGFDEAVCVSLDGFGDFVSTMVGVGRGTRIEVVSTLGFPHSLGAFYTAGTQYLGFERYGDEYKVMGLAPYGQPEFLDAMRDVIRLRNDGRFALNLAMFRHHREIVDTRWDGGEPELGPYYSARWDERFGPRREAGETIADRHRNVACSLQAMTEGAVFHVLRHAAESFPGLPLCLAGGCAQNSVVNGKVRARTPFEDLYVPPAAGDAGTAVGAAMWVWHHVLDGARRPQPDHAFLGPSYTEAEIRRDLEAARIPYRQIDGEAALLDNVAQRLDQGQVVGWFQGRSEWGPRALGNRSLLADPRHQEMRDLLNKKIKRRESFRPFAPAVLSERVADWFEIGHPVPFMSEVHPLSERGRRELPAVTHVDGTGRIQTVDSSTRFGALLRAFEQRTGTPVLLNTSFNENEPIVNTPAEAIDCFRRTAMDALFLGGTVVDRGQVKK